MTWTDYLKYIPEKEPVLGLNLIAALILGGFVAITRNALGWFPPDSPTLAQDLALLGGIALVIATFAARQFAYAPATVDKVRNASYVSGFQTGKEHQP